jgi:hypothetical protein
MKILPRTLTAGALACVLLTTGCVPLSGNERAGGRVPSETGTTTADPGSYAWPTSPAHLQTQNTWNSAEADSYQGDGYGTEVNGVLLALTDSLYTPEIQLNAGTAHHPKWQDVQALPAAAS